MGMHVRGIVLGSALLLAASAVFYAQQKDLPAPFATPTANNRPRVIPQPEGAKLSVPTGFQVEGKRQTNPSVPAMNLMMK